MNLEVVRDVPDAFAHLVAGVAPQSIVLSGGDTAQRCYQRLAHTPGIDWSGIDVYFGDERWVGVHDPASNEGMARDALLNDVAPRAVHSMRDAGDNIVGAAKTYDELLRSAPPLDLVHLGLGPDGHTASLFPGSPALAEGEHWVVATGDEAHAYPRLTMTYPAIASARLVVITVMGAAKRAALAQVLAGDDLPATHVRAARAVWLADRDAAPA
ncbi:MAG: 6-phosphogluconolactonase [Acidimicrobiia bacterium]